MKLTIFATMLAFASGGSAEAKCGPSLNTTGGHNTYKARDEGFDLWNADGTEILNDSTSSLAGNVCLGVWARTGEISYTLKHPSWVYDEAG